MSLGLRSTLLSLLLLALLLGIYHVATFWRVGYRRRCQ